MGGRLHPVKDRPVRARVVKRSGRYPDSVQGKQGIRERDGKQRRAATRCEVMVMFTVFVTVMLLMIVCRSVMQSVGGCHMDGFVRMNNHRGGVISKNGEQCDRQRQEKTKRTRPYQPAKDWLATPQGMRKRRGRIGFRHDETSFVAALLAFRMQTRKPISSRIRLKLMTIAYLVVFSGPAVVGSITRETYGFPKKGE